MGETQDKFVFRQKEPHVFIHSLDYVFISRGASHTGKISGVLLVNLKIGLLHYENIYTRINQMQHLHACSSLMFWPSMVWISIPESTHCFNQFLYAGCAAKSVKPKPELSELWSDSSTRRGLIVSVSKSESQSFYLIWLNVISIHLLGNFWK